MKANQKQKQSKKIKAKSTPVSSGTFKVSSHKSKTPYFTPVLIDQIVCKARIERLLTPQDLNNFGGALKPAKKFKLTCAEAKYFADSFVYPYNKSHKSFSVLGRRESISNGRRLFRAFEGNPLAQSMTKSGASQNKTINKLEQSTAINQFTDAELKQLKATCAGKKIEPQEYLVDMHAKALNNAYDVAFLELNNNNYKVQKCPIRCTRIELYFEVQSSFHSDTQLRSIFNRVIKRFLGNTKVSKSKIEDLRNCTENRETYGCWEIPQDGIDISFKGTTKAVVKLYQKDERLRFEIQMNHPCLKQVKKCKNPYSNMPYLEMKQIADIVAARLEAIQKLFLTEFNKPITNQETQYLVKKIIKRSEKLIPKAYSTTRFEKFAKELANDRSVEANSAKKLKISREVLNKLSDRRYGFLKKMPKSLPSKCGAQNKRIRSANYILLDEKLDLQDLPPAKQKPFLGIEKLAPFSYRRTHSIAPDKIKIILASSGSAVADSCIGQVIHKSQRSLRNQYSLVQDNTDESFNPKDWKIS